MRAEWNVNYEYQIAAEIEYRNRSFIVLERIETAAVSEKI